MKKHNLWPWAAATILFAALLIAALMAAPVAQTVGAQAAAAAAAAQQRLTQEAAQKEFLAESIIAQQEAETGRAFDPSFRAEVKRRLADRSLPELQEALTARAGLGPLSPGASQSDMVFTPVNPCRIIDTRLAGGALAPGVQRDFDAVGVGFAGQGGVMGDCGIPFGPVTAVVINFVAVNPSGAGNLRAWPFGGMAPNASIINYAAVPGGLNIANGLLVPICDPAVSMCPVDLSVIADVNGTHLVADVLGYFQNFKPDTFRRNSATSVTLPATGTVLMTSVAFTPNFTGNALARARGYCDMSNSAEKRGINTSIGTSEADAFSNPANGVDNWGVLAFNAPGTGPALMYSAERGISVTRGVAQTLSVFGRTEYGAGGAECSVSLVVEGLY